MTTVAIFRQHLIMGRYCSQRVTTYLALKTTQWGQFEPHFTDAQMEARGVKPGSQSVWEGTASACTLHPGESEGGFPRAAPGGTPGTRPRSARCPGALVFTRRPDTPLALSGSRASAPEMSVGETLAL